MIASSWRGGGVLAAVLCGRVHIQLGRVNCLRLPKLVKEELGEILTILVFFIS